MGRGTPWYKKKLSAVLSTFVVVIVIIAWLVVLVEGLASFKKPPAASQPIKNPQLTAIPVSCPTPDRFEKTAVLRQKTVVPATILYSFAIHHKFEEFVSLMDVLWEPQHFYVIHVDVKAEPEFFQEVVKFAAKYQNVVLSMERYDVVYYGWSVLWTHLHNFKLAIQLNQTRDYFINMAGADMILKTPREINYFLGENMGRSFIFEHCSWPHYRQWWRGYTWAEVEGKLLQVSNSPRPEPPNLTLRWGQHYVILYRDVVEWMFKEPRVWQFLGYLQNVKSPDEMFYATVLYNSPWNGTHKIFTHSNFKYASWDTCCSGSKLTAGHPCVLGICDIPKLKTLNHIFATKIDNLIDAGTGPMLVDLLKERTEQENKLRRVRRIPLLPGMKLEPEYIEF